MTTHSPQDGDDRPTLAVCCARRRFCEDPAVEDLVMAGLRAYEKDAVIHDPLLGINLGTAYALRPGVILNTLSSWAGIQPEDLKPLVEDAYRNCLDENWGLDLPDEMDPLRTEVHDTPPEGLLWLPYLLEMRDGHYVVPTMQRMVEDDVSLRFSQSAYSEDLRYVPESKSWAVWTGTHWCLGEPASETMAYARMVEYVRVEEAPYWEAQEGREPQRFLEKILKASGIESLLKGTRHRLTSSQEEFDPNPFFLAVANGVIDLEHPDPVTGVFPLLLHSRDYRITKVCPVTYEPAARSELWAKTVGEIMGGRQDRERLLQTALSYSLVGHTRTHVLFIADGEGRNGKGLVLGTVMGVLGNYGTRVRPQLVTSKGREAEHAAKRLKGRRLAWVDELPTNAVLNTGQIKALTGGSILAVRGLYESESEQAPTAKIWISTNTLAAIPETTNAIWDRIITIPFEVSFSGKEDEGLPTKLQAEFSSIFNWLLEGYRIYAKDGIALPDDLKALRDEYRREEDYIAAFISECMEKTTTDIALLWHQMWAAYIEWARRRHAPTPGRYAFGRQLSKHGIHSVTVNGKRIIKGFRLSAEGLHFAGLGGGNLTIRPPASPSGFEEE